MAAEAGNPQAQYALATFYKEGRGVKKEPGRQRACSAAAARSGYTDAEVEYAIALFNGTGVAQERARRRANISSRPRKRTAHRRRAASR